MTTPIGPSEVLRDALEIVSRLPDASSGASRAMLSPVPLHTWRIAVRLIPRAQAAADELELNTKERRKLSDGLREAIDALQDHDGMPASERERRTRNLQVRLTDTEATAIDDIAHAVGLTVSEYVRQMVVELPATVPTLRIAMPGGVMHHVWTRDDGDGRWVRLGEPGGPRRELDGMLAQVRAAIVEVTDEP
jgi:hypothetical protein